MLIPTAAASRRVASRSNPSRDASSPAAVRIAARVGCPFAARYAASRRGRSSPLTDVRPVTRSSVDPRGPERPVGRLLAWGDPARLMLTRANAPALGPAESRRRQILRQVGSTPPVDGRPLPSILQGKLVSMTAATAATEKLLQYLNEAHATEHALTRTLEAHIAITPAAPIAPGSRSTSSETRDHAERLERRMAELGASRSVSRCGVGVVESLVGQALALSKGPLDLVRGNRARRSCSRTPRTSARPRRSRSPPTTPSSALRSAWATRGPPSSRRASAPTRSACSRTCARRSPSSPTP